jgi:hypothetical protein
MADVPALTEAERDRLRGICPLGEYSTTAEQWKLRLKAPQARVLWDVRNDRVWLADHDGEYLDGPKAMYSGRGAYTFLLDPRRAAYRIAPTAQTFRAEYELRREALVRLPEHRTAAVYEWEDKLRQAEALNARVRWPEP